MQAELATHEKPFSYSVKKWRELSGSRTTELKHFRANLKKALNELIAMGEIQDWTIDENDNLHITKPKKDQ